MNSINYNDIIIYIYKILIFKYIEKKYYFKKK